MASAIRSDDPVVFFEHKGLFASKGEPAPPDHVVPLGEARVARAGTDVTVVALAATVPLALARRRVPRGRGDLGRGRRPALPGPARHGHACWPRSSAPAGWSSSRRTRTRAAGAPPSSSIVADEGFELLDAPVRRVAGACVPLPFADALEQRVIPTVDKVVEAVRRLARTDALTDPTDQTPDQKGSTAMGKILLKGGTVLPVDPEIGDLADRRRADRGRPDRRGRGRASTPTPRSSTAPARSSSRASSTPTGTRGRRRSATARPTPPSTTTSSRCSTPSRRCTGPRTSTPATSPAPLECLNAGITTLVDWSHINNTPEHPDAAIQGLKETGIRAQYAYGSANTSLEKYWFFSAEAIPGDDVRRVRETYFPGDDGLLTMGLATRGPGLHPGPGGPGGVGAGPRARHPDHRARRRWAGWPAGSAWSSSSTGSGCSARTRRTSTAATSATTSGSGSPTPAARSRSRRRWRPQMGHGWPPVNKARKFGLRPSLSIDVVTTVPGDMFTQIRAAFGAERARVNAVCWELDTPIPDDDADRRRHAARWPPSTARTSPGVEDRTGSLTPGKQADVVVVDATAVNVAPVHDPVAAVTLSRRRVQRRARARRRRVPQAGLPAARRRGAGDGAGRRSPATTWSPRPRRPQPSSRSRAASTADHLRRAAAADARAGRRPRRARSRAPAGLEALVGGRRRPPRRCTPGSG